MTESTSKKNIINAKNINLTYDHKILDDISFSIQENQSISLVGKSGCGKTSLLSIISSFIQPDSGTIIYPQINPEVDIFSFNDNELSQLRNKTMGFVFQDNNKFIHEFNVIDNIILPALIGKTSKKEAKEKAKYLLKTIGLDGYGRKAINTLSGGQKQRVAIARSLINNPKILFADEPTGNLDQENSDMIMNILLELQKEFKTSLLVITHDPNIAQNMEIQWTLQNGKLLMM